MWVIGLLEAGGALGSAGGPRNGAGGYRMATQQTHSSAPTGAIHARGAGGAELQSAGPLSEEERELVNELVHALRTIRYGSIALTVHDGRLVEIQKTEKIRRKTSES
jgi:hypothetical protein